MGGIRTEEQILVEDYGESPDCSKCNNLMYLEDGMEWGEPPYICHMCEIGILKDKLNKIKEKNNEE